jgi:hypothetical protein
MQSLRSFWDSVAGARYRRKRGTLTAVTAVLGLACLFGSAVAPATADAHQRASQSHVRKHRSAHRARTFVTHVRVSRRYAVTIRARAFRAQHHWSMRIKAKLTRKSHRGIHTARWAGTIRLRKSGHPFARFRARGGSPLVRTILKRYRRQQRKKARASNVFPCGGQIDSAKWRQVGTNAPQGWTLHIIPSQCGRQTGVYFGKSMLEEAARVAGGWKPGLNQDSMLTQLICHAQFAQVQIFGISLPFRTTDWNLDGWRPSENLATMARNQCNPGSDTPPEATPPPPPLLPSPPPSPSPDPTPTPGSTPSPPPPPPEASITASKGGQHGCGNCYALNIQVHNFPTGRYRYYCHDNSGPGGGDRVYYENEVSVTDPNQGTWPGVFCDDNSPYVAYLIMNDVQSNSVQF